MSHYTGITPDERYKMELLDEMKKQTKLLEQLISMNKTNVTPMKQKTTTKKPATRTKRTS